MRLVVTALSSLLLLGACTDSPTPSADPAPSHSLTPISTPTATATPSPEDRFVPNVKGKQVEDARAHLERRGFRVEVNAVQLSACVRNRLVLRQDPPPRYIRDVGSRVTLEVNRRTGGPCGLDLPRPEPDLELAAQAFVEFARGGPADPVLLHHPVALHLGGRLVHTIPDWRAVHRNSYGWLCPTSRWYAGATCPFSAIVLLTRYPGPVAVTSAPPTHPCMHARTFAATRDRTVTLTPDESRTCVDYFAVELEVATDGRLLAVNVLHSEP